MTEQKLERQPKAGPQGSPKYLWRSGGLVEWEKATVHVSMLAWSAISAVFEGIRAYWNPQVEQLYVFQLDAHLKRLSQSMKIMRMTSPKTKEELTQAIVGLLRANECRSDTYVQALAYFEGGVPGYLAVLEEPGEIIATTRPAPSGLDAAKAAHCNVSSWTRISDNVMPPRAKAITNYQNSRYVSTESRINGYDYGIILNPNGKVAEAGYACIYIIRDGVAITPPVTAGILESVTREVVKELLAKDLGTPVIERDVDRTELYVADEVFICGTAVEIQSVGSVDKYKVGDGEQGPVVSRLKGLFREAVLGADARHSGWCTPVY
jgi:branched-chain amino acid aminotransferase